MAQNNNEGIACCQLNYLGFLMSPPIYAYLSGSLPEINADYYKAARPFTILLTLMEFHLKITCSQPEV